MNKIMVTWKIFKIDTIVATYCNASIDLIFSQLDQYSERKAQPYGEIRFQTASWLVE